MKKARRDGRIPKTAQQTIPYREMHRDGLCDVDGHYFTKQVEFLDINYQLAQNEDKNAIFENWCDFLNYFDSSISFQLSFLNQRTDPESFRRSIDIPEQEDAFNGIRREYAGMLRSQLARGNNGLTKTKYITFGVEADSLKAARTRLERIEADVLANFKVLGVKARALDGWERLSILHHMFHPAGERSFKFAWDAVWKTGLTSKDFIAPDSFTFGKGQYFKIGQTYGAASFLQILASELTDRMLADLLDLEGSMVVTLHIQSIDQGAAIRTIKRKLTDLDKMKIEEQKKAVRSGYDMDIIPSDLATYGGEAKTLLEDLQSRNERMFLVTILVVNLAGKRQKLENDIFQAAGIAQKYNCALRRLDYQQEQGLVSSLPLGVNQIEIQRGLTTYVSMILSDPPYGISYQNNFTSAKHQVLAGDEGMDYGLFAHESYRILRDDAHAYFFTRFDCYPYHYECLKQAGFTIKNCMVVEKGTVGGIGDLKGSYANNAEWVIFCQKGRRPFNHTTLLQNRKKEGTRFHAGREPSKKYKTRFNACWFGAEYPKATYNSVWQKKNVKINLDSSAADMQKSIERIEAIGSELRSVGGHVKNIARAVAGKEQQAVDGGREGHFQAAVLAPMRREKVMLDRLCSMVSAAISSVERLEQAAGRGRRTEKAAQQETRTVETSGEKQAEQKQAGSREEKPSVLKTLQEKKAEAAARPAPDRGRRPQEAAI